MKLFFSLSLAFLLCLIGSHASGQQKLVTDILGTPKTISFGNKDYTLCWSSHPNAGYYKEEFLGKGETIARFRSMLLLDAVKSQPDLDRVVDDKLAELAGLQKSDPSVVYKEVAAPAGERMIDFTMTARGADGKTIVIAERNVYRYRSFTDKSGQKGILLFGVAQREYGTAIPGFLARLQNTRDTLVRQVSQFNIPVFKKL